MRAIWLPCVLVAALLGASAAPAQAAKTQKPRFFSTTYKNHAFNARVIEVAGKTRVELAAVCGTGQDGAQFPDRTTIGKVGRRGKVKLGRDKAHVGKNGVSWTTANVCETNGKRRTLHLGRVTPVPVTPAHYRPAPNTMPIWADGGVDVGTAGDALGLERGMQVGFEMGCDPTVSMLFQTQKIEVVFAVGITMDGKAAGKLAQGAKTGSAKLTVVKDRRVTGVVGAGGCDTPGQSGAGGGSFGVDLNRVR